MNQVINRGVGRMTRFVNKRTCPVYQPPYTPIALASDISRKLMPRISMILTTAE